MTHVENDAHPSIYTTTLNFTSKESKRYLNSQVSVEVTSHQFMSQSYLNAQDTTTRATKNYLTSLHSTRKQTSKPLKRPATSSSSSPLNPMHPHVYRVEPVNFKDLVQRLTGAPEPEAVQAKPLKCLDETTKQSSSSFAFDPSSSWGDFSFQNPANLSRW